MVQPNSRRPRRLSRITLCVVLIVLGCQSPLSVRTAAAAGSGPEVIQGLGNYFLTLPYGGIKMAVAVLGTVAGGMGVTFTGGEKVMYEKIWSPALGDKYVMTPPGREGLTFLRQHPGYAAPLLTLTDLDRSTPQKPRHPESVVVPALIEAPVVHFTRPGGSQPQDRI